MNKIYLIKKVKYSVFCCDFLGLFLIKCYKEKN